MDKKQIIRRFLDSGVLLPPNLLETIDEKNIDECIKHYNQHVLTEHKPNKPQPEKQNQKLVIINKPQPEPKEKLTTNDMLKYYINKYGSLKKLILHKTTNTVAINKAKTEPTKLSVIGMVRETNNQGFVIEDPTGVIHVVSKNKPQPDDVVGVTGFAREDKIFADQIIYPDVPLNREIGCIDTEISLANIKTKGCITPDCSPQYIEISDAENRVNILAYKPNKNTDKTTITEFLKKRYLSPETTEIKTTEDVFVIDPIPEVMWVISEDTWSHIYKGVLIISCEAARINLKTKEFELYAKQPTEPPHETIAAEYKTHPTE